MTSASTPRARRARPRTHARGWRRWLAIYVLMAVAWPSAGALPWLVLEHAHHAAAGGESADHPQGVTTSDHRSTSLHDHGATARHDRATLHDEDRPNARRAVSYEDDAGVPGSPTHPLDHDCAQCQVLKHLARCVLPDLVVATVAPLAGAPVPPCSGARGHDASVAAEHPPIRAPPLSRA